jgi:endo-1,4-beta-xylanase
MHGMDRCPPHAIGRRLLGQGAAATALAAAAPAHGQEPGLGAIAAARGIAFGAAIEYVEVLQDPGFAEAVARDCALIVPVNSGKWGRMEHRRGHFIPAALDGLVHFASQHGIPVRGHTLQWHAVIPPWLHPLPAEDVRTALHTHVRRVLDHFRGRIRDWDVVNEVLDFMRPGRTDPLRDSVFYPALGPDFVADLFRLTRDVDPGVRRVFNEFGSEGEMEWMLHRRARLERYLAQLVDAGVPVDAVGLQSHLGVGVPFDPDAFGRHVQRLRALGLEVIVTELDVSEPTGHENRADAIAERDAAVAAVTERYVTTCVQAGIRTFVTWGLADRYHWSVRERPGMRGLPLDAQLNRKPMWHALARAFRSA